VTVRTYSLFDSAKENPSDADVSHHHRRAIWDEDPARHLIAPTDDTTKWPRRWTGRMAEDVIIVPSLFQKRRGQRSASPTMGEQTPLSRVTATWVGSIEKFVQLALWLRCTRSNTWRNPFTDRFGSSPNPQPKHGPEMLTLTILKFCLFAVY